jgi:hypothetical protein
MRNASPLGLTVARPRVLEVRRHERGTFSVGDEAIAEFGPGLLQLMELRSQHGWSVGQGGAFDWTIPVGAAGTAAYAVVEPIELDKANSWTGVSNSVRWQRSCCSDETLIATCRLASLTRAATLAYRVYSSERGDLVVEGEFVFLSVVRDALGLYPIQPRRRPDAPLSARRVSRQGSGAVRPVAPVLATCEEMSRPSWVHLPVWSSTVPMLSEVPVEPATPLLALHQPAVLRTSGQVGAAGAIWEWLFPRDLLRLLGNPVAGGCEPLGRRHHPYGRILEGMGVYAALAISGGAIAKSLGVEWWSPTSGEEHFRVRSKLVVSGEDGAESTHDIFEGERPVGTVRVITGLSC